MELAIIVPTAYLEKYSSQGDIYLALAHLVDDNGTNAYSCFHRREALKGRKVILDNGLFEGEQVDAEVLIQRAKSINASIICAPDVLYDAQGTIKEFKRFIKLKQEEGLVCKVMGIPQASNPVDWWDCFRFFDLSRDCDIIGLSILSIPESFGEIAGTNGDITTSRMHFIRQLCVYKSLLSRRVTPCHLLGLGESYADVILSKRLGLSDTIQSNDSTSVFVHGHKGILYDSFGRLPGGKNKEKLDFSISTLNKQQEECIEHNIARALKIRSFDIDT